MSSSFKIPETVAHQASLSMGFHKQEHWSGLPFLPPGDLPDLGIEPGSLAMQAVSFIFFTAKDFLINGRNSKIHKDLNYFLVEFA